MTLFRIRSIFNSRPARNARWRDACVDSIVAGESPIRRLHLEYGL